jgi:endothelin-converting enzyme/putative endopeptidase
MPGGGKESSLDRSADPCQDFFRFACGNWLKENPVPADESSWYRFSALDEHTRWVLRAILAEAAAERDHPTPNERGIGDYYASCMDVAAVDAKGLAPLRGELDLIAALKDESSLPAEVARVHALGGNALFSFGSGQDYTNAERNIAVADQGGFALPDRDYYFSDDFKVERAGYLRHLQRMFALLGDSPDAAAEEAGAAMKVETALAKGAMGRVERREPKNVHHKTDLETFMKSAPSFGWKEYLSATGAPAFEKLDVADPDFFKGLDAALGSIPLDEWKSYLRWTVVHAGASMLPSDFTAEDFDFFGKKLGGLANKIGYPDKWRDYSKLEIVPGDALGNMQRADAFEFRRQLAKIGRPVDRGEWEMTPPTDNAYYDPQMNDINFPAGILQPPNFDLRADTAAVFGSIGATVGHELTHGFDDEGRHYDARGNMVDWWSAADGKAFEARAQGFVNEYSSFTAHADPKDPAKGIELDGRLTLGENIADNGGLFLAYMALLDALGNEAPPPIDGFDAKQRFFVSYGQSWCMNQTDESIKKQVKSDPHSTGRWRVNGVVSNMPEFGRAFSCKEGSPMLPATAQRVW